MASALKYSIAANGGPQRARTINYSVAPNNSGAQRTGAITAGDQTSTATQPPVQANRPFALNPGDWPYGVSGGTGSFSVTTGTGRFWEPTVREPTELCGHPYRWDYSLPSDCTVEK